MRAPLAVRFRLWYKRTLARDEGIMRHRRVTVLGASGFVGRDIAKHLAHEGASGAAVSRHADDAGFLRPMGDVGQIEPIDADILTDDALDAVVAGAEIVVNAVGLLYE